MDLTEAVVTYGATWNEPDAQARLALLTKAWADDGVYIDPTGRADGRDALLAHIAGFQEMFPGHTIDMTSDVDGHADVFRFAWVMRKGSETVIEGMDYGEVADDGRISRIVGFFGPFPPPTS